MQLVDLQVLNLCKNNLVGKLPKTLPSLSQLRVITDFWMYKSCNVSPDTNLCKVLHVGFNSLQGNLNAGSKPLWWNFTHIETMMLDHNHFTVRLPKWTICKLVFYVNPALTLCTWSKGWRHQRYYILTHIHITGKPTRCPECKNAELDAFFSRKQSFDWQGLWEAAWGCVR